MSTWDNKHMIIAMLMAPILALVAYFGVNFMLSEDPLVAEAGQSYQLVEKPNCRYASGVCGLKNNEFELTFTFVLLDEGRLRLMLESVHPLDGVLTALVENEGDETPPLEMLPAGSDGLSWSLDIPRPDPENHRMRLVASAGGAHYFGDIAMKFTLAKSVDN